MKQCQENHSEVGIWIGKRPDPGDLCVSFSSFLKESGSAGADGCED